MSKHTPGPWRYRKGDEWSHSVVTDHGTLPDGSENAWTVATLNKNRDEHEANAKLIAAAPELLEALILLEKEMVLSGNAQSVDYGWKPAIEKTRAAIAKATGAA
jgi:hypothetical protein